MRLFQSFSTSLGSQASHRSCDPLYDRAAPEDIEDTSHADLLSQCQRAVIHHKLLQSSSRDLLGDSAQNARAIELDETDLEATEIYDMPPELKAMEAAKKTTGATVCTYLALCTSSTKAMHLQSHMCATRIATCSIPPLSPHTNLQPTIRR